MHSLEFTPELLKDKGKIYCNLSYVWRWVHNQGTYFTFGTNDRNAISDFEVVQEWNWMHLRNITQRVARTTVHSSDEDEDSFPSPTCEEGRMMEATDNDEDGDWKPHAKELASPIMGFGDKEKDKGTIYSEIYPSTTSDQEQYEEAKKHVAGGILW
jgi:hypothetical protein